MESLKYAFTRKYPYKLYVFGQKSTMIKKKSIFVAYIPHQIKIMDTYLAYLSEVILCFEQSGYKISLTRNKAPTVNHTKVESIIYAMLFFP